MGPPSVPRCAVDSNLFGNHFHAEPATYHRKYNAQQKEEAHAHSAAITRAALQDPRISGFATWTRFPVFAIENTNYGYRVAISDARYSQRVGQGLGATIVELDHELNVR